MSKFSNKQTSNADAFLSSLIINFKTLIILLYAYGDQSMLVNSNINLLIHNIVEFYASSNKHFNYKCNASVLAINATIKTSNIIKN